MHKLKIVKLGGLVRSTISKKGPRPLKKLGKTDVPLYTPKCNDIIRSPYSQRICFPTLDGIQPKGGKTDELIVAITTPVGPSFRNIPRFNPT